MPDSVVVQIRFSALTKYGNFSDALTLSQEEYAVKTPQEIEDMKQARVDAWVSLIDNTKANPSPEPTKEESLLGYQELKTEANRFLEKYIPLADKSELETIKSDLVNKTVEIETEILAKGIKNG